MKIAKWNRKRKVRWDARYKERPEAWLQPDEFLVRVYDPFLQSHPAGLALDLAGGAGRNSCFWWNAAGEWTLVDISEVGLDLGQREASRLENVWHNRPRLWRSALYIQHADLNAISDLGTEQYDLIIVFYFLRRELFPALISALKPGGMLTYRTYTIDRMKVPGGPYRSRVSSSTRRTAPGIQFARDSLLQRNKNRESCGGVGSEEGW